MRNKLLIFTILYPYVFALGTAAFFIITSIWYLLFVLAVTFVFSMVGLIGVIQFLKSDASPFKMAQTAMRIKLVQIPAYIINLVLTFIFMIGLFHAAILAVIAFGVVDFVAIFLTGLILSGASYRLYKNKKASKIFMITTIVCGFIFCIDVADSVIVFYKSKSVKGVD